MTYLWVYDWWNWFSYVCSIVSKTFAKKTMQNLTYLCRLASSPPSKFSLLFANCFCYSHSLPCPTSLRASHLCWQKSQWDFSYNWVKPMGQFNENGNLGGGLFNSWAPSQHLPYSDPRTLREICWHTGNPTNISSTSLLSISLSVWAIKMAKVFYFAVSNH